jgi:hypothetical protein
VGTLRVYFVSERAEFSAEKWTSVSPWLLVSGELECVEEMLTVAAYLQVQSVWASSRGRQKMLDEVKERFAVAEGRGQPDPVFPATSSILMLNSHLLN